jgi:hypothetical protein
MKAMQLLVLTGATLGMGLLGCDQKTNPVTDATRAVGGAVKDASNAAADTAAKTADAAKDAGTKAVDATKDAAKGATDAVKAAADKVMAEGKTWLTDTVEKSWPGMKTQLESAGKLIPNIKDAGVKTKAEGLFKDLTGQIPGIEGLVTKLKGADASSFGALFTEAKKAWDGFGGKMKDLIALLPK